MEFTREQQVFMLDKLKQQVEKLKEEPRCFDDLTFGAISFIYALMWDFDEDIVKDSRKIFARACDLYQNSI